MDQSDFTRILAEVKKGQPGASDALINDVYNELRRRAAARMRRERPSNTFQPTDLVHEVYLRLGDLDSIADRKDFFIIASNLMRQILIDRARSKKAGKRGGDVVKITLDEGQVTSGETADELLDLHEALERLAAIAPLQAEIVQLRYFGGLSVEEIADVCGIADRTVDRDWRAARAWLLSELKRANPTRLC